MSCARSNFTYFYVKWLITSVINLYAGEIQKTLVCTFTISLSFHYVNHTHPSPGGKLCMWTGFVLMIERFVYRVVLK